MKEKKTKKTEKSIVPKNRQFGVIEEMRKYIAESVKADVSLEEIIEKVKEKYDRGYEAVRYQIKILKQKGEISRYYIDTAITEESLKKFEKYIARNYTVRQACFKSGIPKSSIYYFWTKHPEHKEYCEDLSTSVVMKAKDVLEENIGKRSTDIAKFIASEENRKERKKLEIEIQANRTTETPQEHNYTPPRVSVKFTLK